MNFTARFSVQPCDERREVSRLYDRGRDTGRIVPGLILDAQVRVGEEGWALFLTHDCPFEERLDIVLLDRAMKIVERADLSAPYAPGIFRIVSGDASQTLDFEFIGDGVWSVAFFDRPRPRVPFWGEPAGVHRPLGFRRRFRLSYRRG